MSDSAEERSFEANRIALLAGPLIKYFKSQGCIVVHKCTTIRHAKVRFNFLAFLSAVYPEQFRVPREWVSISLAWMGWSVSPEVVGTRVFITTNSRCRSPRRGRYRRAGLGMLQSLDFSEKLTSDSSWLVQLKS